MRAAQSDRIVDLAPHSRLLGHEGTKAQLRVADQMASKLRNVEVRIGARLLFGESLDDVKQRDTSTSLPREIQREPEGLESRR